MRSDYIAMMAGRDLFYGIWFVSIGVWLVLYYVLGMLVEMGYVNAEIRQKIAIIFVVIYYASWAIIYFAPGFHT